LHLGDSRLQYFGVADYFGLPITDCNRLSPKCKSQHSQANP
jgi:hypothetical protein